MRFTRKPTFALVLASSICVSSTGITNFSLFESHAEESVTVTEYRVWDFDSIQTDSDAPASLEWEYNSGWDGNYHGTANTAVSYDADGHMLRVHVDYSQDIDQSWSQIGICHYENGMQLKGVNQLTFDFYYDSANKTTGTFHIKAYSNCGVDATVSINEESAETVSGTLKKVPVTIDFPSPINTETTDDFTLCLVGVNTDYTGDISFDNIKLLQKTDNTDIYVDATVTANSGNTVSTDGISLLTATREGGSETTPFLTQARLVDGNATANTKAIYEYLDAMGKSSSVIYGHQNDTWHKAGSAELSSSDTYDVTGQYAGVVGMDTLSMTGNEYSADRYNSEIGTDNPIDIAAVGRVKANVIAAARLANANIANGSILTLSAHMPNFSIVGLNETYNAATDPSYSKYDFSGYSPNNLSGDTANELLPGGKYNEVYNAYLDMIADFASQVDGTILFRPFHECTGSWFWWGAALCNAETYKNIYRYTVEYLRDTKNVHNMLYVYGPGSEAASVEDYALRYPGDEYVDMVGFDMYHSNASTAEETAYFNNFKNEIAIVQTFAQQHGKLFAVTETGAASDVDAGDSQTALHKTGNADKDWYNQVLECLTDSNASYFLLWANFSKTSGFYTPYVESINADNTLHGHEMLDYFIRFYNDPRSVFSSDQKDILASLTSTISSQISTASGVQTQTSGYITAPIAGRRILEAMDLTANISNYNGQSVSFVLQGQNSTQTLPATINESTASALLSADALALLGESANGHISLVIGEQTVQTIDCIFNIPEPEEDIYEIDNFENYYGVDSLLTQKWAVNKDTGCSINLHLVNDEEIVYSGDYAMEFLYSETSTGWAGATINKEVNWSDCNALQFYTIPDGKNQKVVVQLTANGICYETYLNLYEEYAADTDGTPLLVTIPFADFVQRDTDGHPAGGLLDDCANVTSFGLWVNAISGSEAIDETGMVTGTIYYDKITAVSADSPKATFIPVKEVPEEPSSEPIEETTEESGSDSFEESTRESDYSSTERPNPNATPSTGDSFVLFAWLTAAASALFGIFEVITRRRNN